MKKIFAFVLVVALLMGSASGFSEGGSFGSVAYASAGDAAFLEWFTMVNNIAVANGITFDEAVSFLQLLETANDLNVLLDELIALLMLAEAAEAAGMTLNEFIEMLQLFDLLNTIAATHGITIDGLLHAVTRTQMCLSGFLAWYFEMMQNPAPPPVLSPEFAAIILDDFAAYFNLNNTGRGALTIDAYFGRFNGRDVMFIGGLAFGQAITHFTVSGFEFIHNTTQPMNVYYNSQFLNLAGAYEQGWLTANDVSRIWWAFTVWQLINFPGNVHA